jgi:hypothetical protein
MMPRGFYSAYLEHLADRREATGEKAPDIYDDAYWRERRKNHAATPRRRNRTARTELRKRGN